MAPSDRDSSEVGRRASVRYSARRSTDNTIDEEDLYGLETVGVSDGFRPSHVSNQNRISFQQQSQQLNSNDPQLPLPRPSSTLKPKTVDNFALRHDGAAESSSSEAPIELTEARTSSRTTSISTDAPIIVPDGPYHGPTRPSHPYQMYPQNSRPARTGSVTTTATFPTSEPGYSGPTHPYAMYTQSTAVEPEAVHDGVPAANIPVGFPGLAGDQYQRRLGPDGEEAADIIGPGGHTEQLPPYTKYPDEAFARKLRTIPSSEGAGGIGLATRNPEFSSREDLSNSPAVAPSRQSTLSATSGEPVEPAAAPVSEKPAEKTWKVMAKQKVCGFLPVWALAVIVAIIIVIALLVGSVLGVLVTKEKEKDQKASHATPTYIPSSGDYYTTVTTTVDATPLATLPADLPALPTGTFSLYVGRPQSVQTVCLADASQLSAWSCDMPPTNMQVTIASLGPQAPNVSNHVFSIEVPPSTKGFSYGTQPPVFSPSNVMNLVRDYDDPHYGPAWFFQVFYDKIVIIPEMALGQSSARKRADSSTDLPGGGPPDGGPGGGPAGGPPAGSAPTGKTPDGGPPAGKTPDGGPLGGDPLDGGPLGRSPLVDSTLNASGFARHGIAKGGEMPWFCYWNGTLLEVFVFPNVTSETSKSFASIYSDGSISSETSSSGYGEVGDRRTVWESPTTPATPEASAAETATGSYSSTAAAADTTAAPNPASSVLPPYPKLLKIEERRMPRRQYDQPYCVQMEISLDGKTATPATDADGGAVIVELDERAGPVKRDWDDGKEDEELGLSESRKIRTKRDSDNDCHCAWTMG